MEEPKRLEFVPVASSINPSFWNKLVELKIDVDKLNETVHQIWGYFSNIHSNCSVPVLEVDSTSFNTLFDYQKFYIPFHGKILNKNTIEQFKECDKTELINKQGKCLIEDIQNGKILEMPSKLNTFFILSFADLKKYHFYYWFAFPVPNSLILPYNYIYTISDVFHDDQISDLLNEYISLDIHQKPYFLIHCNDSKLSVHTLKSNLVNVTENNYQNYYFAFCDISLMENCPGSSLRNYAALILYNCSVLKRKSINFLSFRLTRSQEGYVTCLTSVVFNIQMPADENVLNTTYENLHKSFVGWEKNERGKLGPRFSNMKSVLDPIELAESSVDLNLKLMKWRLLSNINLEKIKETKFLLLGTGTLGCSVARVLLAWGVRYFTFVDNSTVSFSNPVRQSLFTYEDSKNSKPKSLAAAENIKKIFPSVNSQAHQLNIPMPGHRIGEAMLDSTKAEVEKIAELISTHDVIFLLMDSRESRWLPTLLGAYYDKIVINAALGFESYLVMRHGTRKDIHEFKVRQHPEGFKSLKGNELGCYFCNDVTAPGNSTKDRTLDQQCTVTRPGVSAIAGALAAELAISILQHKEGAKAAAFYQVGTCLDTEATISNQSVLGILPHTIRGYLSTFSQVLPATHRYRQCVACSDVVLEQFGLNGFQFLLKVFQDSKYLEDITGLTKINEEANNVEMWEFSDEEEIMVCDIGTSFSKIGDNNSGQLQEPLGESTENNLKSLLIDETNLSSEEIGLSEDIQLSTTSVAKTGSKMSDTLPQESIKLSELSLTETNSKPVGVAVEVTKQSDGSKSVLSIIKQADSPSDSKNEVFYDCRSNLVPSQAEITNANKDEGDNKSQSRHDILEVLVPTGGNFDTSSSVTPNDGSICMQKEDEVEVLVNNAEEFDSSTTLSFSVESSTDLGTPMSTESET